MGGAGESKRPPRHDAELLQLDLSCLDANVRHLQRSASSSPHVLSAKVDFFQLFHEREREREEEEEESRLTPKLCMPFGGRRLFVSFG